jgi:hypothetical protein
MQQQPCLKSHFADALRLLGKRAELGHELKEWRQKARSDGLDCNALIKLAREQLRTAEEQRKAAEAAEIEELYRKGLDLPLFRVAA